MAAYGLVLAVALVALVTVYVRRYRSVPWTVYRATPAWIRAGIYFCACFLIAWASGATEKLLDGPIATSDQLRDPTWIGYTLAALGFICVAYGIVWVHFTVRFDRPLTPVRSTLFGVLWGLSSGQLFLSVWLIANDVGLPEPAAWVVTWLVLGAWQPNFHNIYWDHWIAPEHDTRLTQRIKALGCHIPNLLITLTYLALFDNALIFVGLQVIACVSASAGMRFPAPGYVGGPHELALRSDARIPRCLGYVPEPDPESDPYVRFAWAYRLGRRPRVPETVG